MSGVINNTARQFNLKAIEPKSGKMVTVRVAPGANDIEDAHWNVIKTHCKQAEVLKKDRHIEYGTKKADEAALTPDTKSKSKASTSPPKGKKES